MSAKAAEDPELPEHCNCNQLRRAARRVSRYYDQCLAGTGIKATQHALLGYLASEGPMTMARLADRLAMDRATVGHNLRPLERDGLIKITTSDNDRRSRMVAITSHGLSVMVAARPAWQKAQAEFEAAIGTRDTPKIRKLASQIAEVSFGASFEDQ